MSNGLSKKLLHDKDFMAHMAELTSLFGKSDRKALEAAVRDRDFRALCKALKITEEAFGSILARGGEKAKNLMKDPEIAEAVRRQGQTTTG